MVLPISEGASAYLEIAQQNEHLFFIGCFSLCQDSIYTRILYLDIYAMLSPSRYAYVRS